MMSNDFNNSSNYNLYGLSASFLESLGISGPLHNKVFVANVSIQFLCNQRKNVKTRRFVVSGVVSLLVIVNRRGNDNILIFVNIVIWFISHIIECNIVY